MFKKKPYRRKARLSLAPMLDMIFILLIFFIVSTTFSKLPGILINRPTATTPDILPPHNLMIGITQAGKIFIDKKQYSQDELLSYLSKSFSSSPNLSVLIIADENSLLKYSIKVMDLCKQIGIDNIGIAEEVSL